jgi:hypothetical protein
MPTYLAERYLPGHDRDAGFCRFEAETANDVRYANEIAGVPFARTVAAEDTGIRHPEPAKKGNRS